uniref:Uncharacterized protein n=1 Tax=Glossina palpalis gambiensis TaxID=67801 RepID=A0A1B0BQY8_9MUSC
MSLFQMGQGTRSRAAGGSPQRKDNCVVDNDTTVEVHNSPGRQLTAEELRIFDMATPQTASRNSPVNMSPPSRDSSPPRQCPKASYPIYNATRTNLGRPARMGTPQTRRNASITTPEDRSQIDRAIPATPVQSSEYGNYNTPMANIDYYGRQQASSCPPGRGGRAAYRPHIAGVKTASMSSGGRGRPLAPPAGYGSLSKKLLPAIMPAAKSSKLETPTNYDQVVAARARNVYGEAADYPKSSQECPSPSGMTPRRSAAMRNLGECVFGHTTSMTTVKSDSPLTPGARGQIPYNVYHRSQGKKYYTPTDGPPVTSVQCRTVRVKPPSQPLIELYSGSMDAQPALPQVPNYNPLQPGRSPAHTPGQTPMRLMVPTSAQTLQTPQRPQPYYEESGDKSRSQTGERGPCPGLARRQPLQAIGAPQNKSAVSILYIILYCLQKVKTSHVQTNSRPSPCPLPQGPTQSRPQEDRGRQPAIEFSSDKPREQSSGRTPKENYAGQIVRRSPSPPRSAPTCPQTQLPIYEGAGDKTRSQSALRALEIVLAEPSRSISDFVTEKSRGASPQREPGRSEASPAAASPINQAGSSKASSPANKANPDNPPSRSESPNGNNTGWIVADQLIGALEDFINFMPPISSTDELKICPQPSDQPARETPVLRGRSREAQEDPSSNFCPNVRGAYEEPSGPYDVDQGATGCEEMIEQRIAGLRNLPLLEDDPVYHLGRTLNTDEHIILDEILEDEIRELPRYQPWPHPMPQLIISETEISYHPNAECLENAPEQQMAYLQMSPDQSPKKERRTEDKSTLAQAENVCAPCPSRTPSEQELDKPNIFKSIAKKIGITMEILSKLIHGRQSSAMGGTTAESSSQANQSKPEDSKSCGNVFSKKPHASCPIAKKKGPNIRNLYTEEEPDDDVELPESYKACANAKKCGRIKFDKFDHCDDVAVATATRQIQIKELVMDNYCPGAIQEAVDGKEDFNAVAFELARVSCAIDEKTCTNAPAEEPLSIIEAFLMRIDLEREGMKKGLKKDASEEEIKTTLRKYFESEHNPTDLNSSINSLLMAEALTDVAIAKASKTVTFEADVQKWASSVPDNPNVKLVSYTATTNPVILEESPQQPETAAKTPDPS